MSNQAKIIITWAANESNAYGAHIQALTSAIEGGRVSADVVEELKLTRSKWTAEADKRHG